MVELYDQEVLLRMKILGSTDRSKEMDIAKKVRCMEIAAVLEIRSGKKFTWVMVDERFKRKRKAEKRILSHSTASAHSMTGITSANSMTGDGACGSMNTETLGAVNVDEEYANDLVLKTNFDEYHI